MWRICEFPDGFARGSIISIDESIEFLATDAPEQKSRNEVIIDVQAWPFGFSEEGKQFAKDNGCKETSILGCIEWLSKVYNWQIKSDPIPSWKSRLNSLSIETDLHLALKKYGDFMRQSENIRSFITEAAIQLDTHIQQQIDLARGK